MRDIVGAVAYLDSRGAVHRDIKADNILIDCEDNAKLSDFGMAKKVSHSSFTSSCLPFFSLKQKKSKKNCVSPCPAFHATKVGQSSLLCTFSARTLSSLFSLAQRLGMSVCALLRYVFTVTSYACLDFFNPPGTECGSVLVAGVGVPATTSARPGHHRVGASPVVDSTLQQIL